MAGHLEDGAFDFGLDGGAVFLDLPALEGGAVVGDLEAEVAGPLGGGGVEFGGGGLRIGEGHQCGQRGLVEALAEPVAHFMEINVRSSLRVRTGIGPPRRILRCEPPFSKEFNLP